MKRPASLFYVIILLLISTGVVSAGTTTLTTYYPAPAGNYDKLRLVPQSGAALASPCPTGTMYVDNTGVLQYCDNSNGNMTGVWGSVPGAWKQSGTSIYPTVLGNSVAVGTSTTTTGKLSVLSADGPSIALYINNTANGSNRLEINGFGRLYQYTGNGLKTAILQGEIGLYNALNALAINFHANGNSYFNTVGNVGIGVATPAAKLEIKSTTASAGSYPFLRLYDTNTALGSLATRPVFRVYSTTMGFPLAPKLDITGLGMLQQYHPNGVLKNCFTALGDSYITGGNVGIGVTNPGAYKLNVNGNVNITGDETVTGAVTAGGFFYSSDSRLKKDIEPITHALDKVQRLNGITFAWKKNNVKDIGVTAQNVEKVVPELVATGPNGLKSIAYGNMVALLIESIKEQQKQIDGQQKQISELSSELKRLKR